MKRGQLGQLELYLPDDEAEHAFRDWLAAHSIERQEGAKRTRRGPRSTSDLFLLACFILMAARFGVNVHP